MARRNRNKQYYAKVVGQNLWLVVGDGSAVYTVERGLATIFNAKYINEVIRECKHESGASLEKDQV